MGIVKIHRLHYACVHTSTSMSICVRKIVQKHVSFLLLLGCTNMGHEVCLHCSGSDCVMLNELMKVQFPNPLHTDMRRFTCNLR